MAGDDLEFLIQGHSVCRNYTISINLDYVNYKGERISQTWDHEADIGQQKNSKIEPDYYLAILAKLLGLP